MPIMSPEARSIPARGRPAKNIARADDDAHFDARVMDFLDFIGDLVD